jgi:adenylate cyclase class IV
MHDEIELKFDAIKVNEDAFVAFCMTLKPERYERVESPDVYYRKADYVIRHRLSGGGGELTVKLRKPKKSVVDRKEIDLHFSDKTTINDIQEFLKATGWKEQVSLYKKAHIFWFQHRGQPRVSVVLYDAFEMVGGNNVKHHRFAEIEVEKGEIYSIEESKLLLNNWRKAMEASLPLGKLQTKSLYEIYTGRRYRTVQKR